MLESPSDNELYELFLQGEQDAMRSIVKRNSPRLFCFIYRMVGDSAVSEELVQEVFLKLVKTRPNFSSGTKVSTFLFQVARNLAIDELRKLKHRRQHLSLDQENPGMSGGGGSDTKLQERMVDSKSETDRGAMDGELRARIEQGLALLPPEQREVFCLREVEGLSFAEIAKVVGCSENTAKSRMRYALEKLRAYLKEFKV